ncbi:2'-5' RNA ligase family protein [Rhizobium sp. SSA_523]|uniref:2'-5' RNA ligase family protein n=1 Tax=Rhizobium sp. SSA_523 TaxID=2952477 RepID=UPI00208FFB6C|nr:2'-5' RNA ligase family protein [Rhizobium sp. SSA_523]MCO5732503.1 2'-5' RNA ligase family protein [Rhizobium sp. SSA_523]WKC22357.1 2'-5' RNA ligase family protein [Rhizobium sp. SSA_523]
MNSIPTPVTALPQQDLVPVKTLQPLILTARIAEADLAPFDQLRQRHFPRDRVVLPAHLTMFHRLPGEYRHQVRDLIAAAAGARHAFEAPVTGLRHLGGGVAFVIESVELEGLRAELRKAFAPWLGGQDMQKWQAHITIQNKVTRLVANETYECLSAGLKPTVIHVEGVDLRTYKGGPWEHEQTVLFAPQAGSLTGATGFGRSSPSRNP